MRDDDRKRTDADSSGARDDSLQNADDARFAADTDGWTMDIPRAANAAGSPRPGDGDVESDEPTQGADPDLAVDPRRDEED